METAILHAPPGEMNLHPLLAATPGWSDDDPRMLALIEDVRARGVDSPIQTDGEMRILDGRHRWRAAKRAKIETVPYTVYGGAPITLMVQSLLQRRHYTPGQRAYLVQPLMEKAWEEAHEVLLAGKKDEARAREVEDWAKICGVSVRYMQHACQLHRRFSEERELRDEFEPRILDGDDPIGLGAALAGIAGRDATRKIKRPTRAAQQLSLFSEGWDSLGKRCKYWSRFGPEERALAEHTIREALQEMPEDLLAVAARAAKDEIKRRAAA